MQGELEAGSEHCAWMWADRIVSDVRPRSKTALRALATAVSTQRAGEWRAHLQIAGLAIAASAAVFAYALSHPGRLPNNFYQESWPAYAALAHGHVLGFVRLGPAYVGSLVLRVPFALLPALEGGGWQAVYVASAIPCMIAVAGLCVWLAAQPRQDGGTSWARRVLPIACCILNWAVVAALLGGHPEEILGATFCIGAVVLAVNARPGLAGLLVGLAVVNKSWAVVAVPVVLAVMPGGRRRGLLVAAATVGALLVPVLALRSHGFSGAATGAQVGTIFNPPQLLWWFGSRSWIVQQARPVIVLVAIACAGLWWARRPHSRSGKGSMQDALLLLALVLLLRAALDPWNNLYYHVPFLLALVAFEMRSGRMPVMTVLYSTVFILLVPIGGALPMSADFQAAAYAVAVIPMVAWIAAKLYLPSRVWARFPIASRARRSWRPRERPVTVSSQFRS